MQVVNSQTGEIETYDNIATKREQKKFTQSRRGWTKMYRNGTEHKRFLPFLCTHNWRKKVELDLVLYTITASKAPYIKKVPYSV